MTKCLRNSDCRVGELCINSNCLVQERCFGVSDCPLGRGCHPTLRICVPLFCKSSGDCPDTHYCYQSACMVRGKLDESCKDDSCELDLSCWRETCKRICKGSTGSCPPGQTCSATKGSIRICTPPSRGVTAVAGTGSGSEREMDSFQNTMFKLMVFSIACLLVLCFILFIIMTILRAIQRRRDIANTFVTSIEAGDGGTSEPRQVIPTVAPLVLEPKSPDSSIDTIDSSSPSVKSVREMWEQRGRLIMLGAPPRLNSSSTTAVNDKRPRRSKSREQDRSHSRTKSSQSLQEQRF